MLPRSPHFINLKLEMKQIQIQAMAERRNGDEDLEDKQRWRTGGPDLKRDQIFEEQESTNLKTRKTNGDDSVKL